MDVIGLIAAHGYWIVLVVAFVDQFGAPIPSIAILVAAGAVAGQGQITVIGVLAARGWGPWQEMLSCTRLAAGVAAR